MLSVTAIDNAQNSATKTCTFDLIATSASLKGTVGKFCQQGDISDGGTCNNLLALMSPASYRSEICRAEQLRALRKSRRVIPVLVQTNAERPIWLEALN